MERVISGIIAIPIVLGIILYGHLGLFFFLIASIVLIAAHEYFSMIANAGISGFPIEGLVLSFLLLATWFFIPQFSTLFGVFIPLTLFIVWCFREKNVRVALDSISYTLFGILYVAGLGGYFLLIRNFGGGERLIFFLLLIVWLGDIAAYYWGKNFGKKPLAPVVSPNKTMEGAIAGLAGSLAAGAIAGYWFLDHIAMVHCLLVALICGTIGQFGDLAESLLKRYAGIKNSGDVLPGHGGVLDRIDSLLFAGPMFYCYFKLVL